MRLTCPACHAETSLEVLVGREADARAVSAFLARHVQLGDVLVQYVALFRPPKRRLGLARMVALIEELMPDIERGAIARKGRDWPAPVQAWRIAIGQVLLNRDKGTLSLPLSGHGYLYEVLQGVADKAEAQAEREAEGLRRGRAHVDTGPAKLQPGAAVSAALPAPVADMPSAEIRARLAKARQSLALRGLPVPPIPDGGSAP